jgi:iron complex outermembrane receptor protein
MIYQRFYTLILILACIVPNTLGATGFVLKAVVLDKQTHAPVSDVNVQIAGESKKTQTNRSGAFLIYVAHSGKYRISCSHLGYKTISQSITTDSLNVEIYLEQQTVNLSEVTVKTNKAVTPLNEITVEPSAWATSITNISADQIRKMGATSTLDALKYSTDGLPSTQGRRKKYYYLVRGQNMAADYSINGVSLSTNGAGPMAQWIEAPSMLPATMIESIEVVRSGNSLLLGFSGLNGVVNVKTKTFDHFTTQAEVSYGTFNSYRAGLLHGGKIQNFNYAISIYNDKTDGPANRHSYENLWNVYGKIGFKYKKLLELNIENFYTYGTRFVTQAMDYQGLTLPMRQLADIWEYDPMRYNISTFRLKINEAKLASTELQMSYILNRMDLYPDTHLFTVDPTTNKSVVGDSIIRKHMLNEPDTVLTLAAFQAIQPFANNYLRVAAMYASSANYTHGKSKRSIYSLAVLDQHSFGKMDIHAGVKLIREYYNYYVPNQGFGDETRAIQNQWQPALLNFSTGISYQSNNHLSYNAVMNSGELPVDNSSLQLYDDGSVGKLKGEQRTGLDLGLAWKTEPIGTLEFTLFGIRQNNTSEYTTRSYYDEDGLIRYYERNINLTTLGVECTYQSPVFNDRWSGFANLSYKQIYQSQNSEYKKYTKQPPFIGNIGISYAYKILEMNLMGKYVSQYMTDRFLQKEVSVGNYFNWDFTVNCRILNTCLETFGLVVNILDVHYCTVSPIYPDFGRQLKIGLRAKL